MILKKRFKIPLYIALLLIALIYHAGFGYYLTGYMHGGQIMALPFFLVFAFLLGITLFNKRVSFFFLGPTIVFSLVIIIYSEIASYLYDELGSEWHNYMFVQDFSGKLLKLLWFIGAILTVIYEIVAIRKHTKNTSVN
ncbi:hypothetical protein EYV94_12970 [Puteibacter caeruleilacunae]|nr:hypothetical protein EYV94_12970 [Puteibacter caeruleilacunae]